MNVTVLNSRQGKIFCGSDEWVIKTIKAVKHAVSNNFTILTSIGYKTWELLFYIALQENANIELIIPQNTDTEKVIANFEIKDKSKVNFLEIPSEHRKKSWWCARDKFIIQKSDIVYPISLRPESTMWKLIAEKTNISIIKDFETSYNPRQLKVCVPRLNEIDKQLDDKLSDYLIHWTHTFYEPWQDETKAQFYRSIIDSNNEYSHSAYNTLRRILRIRKIYGTDKVRGDTKVVSFTDAGLLDSLRLMSWRKGLTRLYWEPYGIAIKRDELIALGTRPVIYGDEDTYKSLPSKLQPYFQPIAGRRHDWTQEKEWRVIGNLLLNNDILKKTIFLTKEKSEAQQMSKEFNIASVIALKSD